MTISRIRGLKYFRLSCALTLVGAVLALVLNLGVASQMNAGAWSGQLLRQRREADQERRRRERP